MTVGLAREAGDRVRDEPRPLGSALEHETFAVGCPPAVADACTGEVHDGAHTLEGGRVDRAGVGIPPDRVHAARRVAPAHAPRIGRCPAATSAGTSAEPMKPLAPVTKTSTTAR